MRERARPSLLLMWREATQGSGERQTEREFVCACVRVCIVDVVVRRRWVVVVDRQTTGDRRLAKGDRREEREKREVAGL